MAGGSVPDAGEQVPCPRCGEVGYQKAMIPVLVGEGPAHELICVACARALRPDAIKADDTAAVPTPTA